MDDIVVASTGVDERAKAECSIPDPEISIASLIEAGGADD
jgi:hypothetical protein